MICLDTSSMIAYLEGQEGKDITLIDHALLDQIAVFAPFTVSELLSASTVSPSLRETLLAIPMLSIEDGFWERAGLLRAKILAKGSKARLADTLISQTCLDHGVPLITRDRDFQIFQRVAKLQLL
jgi:predicted nucleic acid-binding protein